MACAQHNDKHNHALNPWVHRRDIQCIQLNDFNKLNYLLVCYRKDSQNRRIRCYNWRSVLLGYPMTKCTTHSWGRFHSIPKGIRVLICTHCYPNILHHRLKIRMRLMGKGVKRKNMILLLHLFMDQWSSNTITWGFDFDLEISISWSGLNIDGEYESIHISTHHQSSRFWRPYWIWVIIGYIASKTSSI